MATTQTQNCQRGVVFLNFLIILLFFIMVTIRFIKKLIDPIQEGDERYKEEEGKQKQNKQVASKKPATGQDTTLNLDQLVKKSQPINEDDPTGIKMAKKFQEIEKLIFPLVIVFPLNLILGTAYSFLIVDFFFLLIVLILINILGLHKTSCENKVVRCVLQNIWLLLIFFMFVNKWGARTTLQPYVLV